MMSFIHFQKIPVDFVAVTVWSNFHQQDLYINSQEREEKSYLYQVNILIVVLPVVHYAQTLFRNRKKYGNSSDEFSMNSVK